MCPAGRQRGREFPSKAAATRARRRHNRQQDAVALFDESCVAQGGRENLNSYQKQQQQEPVGATTKSRTGEEEISRLKDDMARSRGALEGAREDLQKAMDECLRLRESKMKLVKDVKERETHCVSLQARCEALEEQLVRDREHAERVALVKQEECDEKTRQIIALQVCWL